MPAATPAQLEKFTNQGTETSQSPRAQEYMDAVRKTQIVQDMLTRQMDWEWAEARLVVDDPAKALDRAQRKDYRVEPRARHGATQERVAASLAVLRADQGRHGGLHVNARARRAGLHSDERTRSDGHRGCARRLREMAKGSAGQE